MYRRILAFALVLVLLSGCSLQEHFASSTEPQSTTDTSATVETELPETSHSTTPPETSLATEETAAPIETTVETEPSHSELFIPFVTPEEMVTYFNEVCLDAEFVNSGNASVLQRWENPIYYQIYGDPTDLDLQILNNMCQWLNTIDGFPGIYETAETWQENYSIYFCTQAELIDRMGDEYYGVDGAFTFWYNDNIIYDCTVCIRTDLDQEVRNSVILEELYNSLGPAQDTNLRQESIIYAGYSIPQALHPIDEVILKLLYHPDLLIGMDARDCEPIIHSLYY